MSSFVNPFFKKYLCFKACAGVILLSGFLMSILTMISFVSLEYRLNEKLSMSGFFSLIKLKVVFLS